MFIFGHNFIVESPLKHNSLEASDDKLCLLTRTMDTWFLWFRSFSYLQYSTVKLLLLISCLTTWLAKLKFNLHICNKPPHTKKNWFIFSKFDENESRESALGSLEISVNKIEGLRADRFHFLNWYLLLEIQINRLLS